MIDFREDEATHKAKMIFADESEYTFNVWNGTPQRPKPVIDTFRRLGSSRQRIQKLGNEATISSSMGKIADADIPATEELYTKVGDRFTLEFYGQTYENCILYDIRISFGEFDYGGLGNTMATCLISYLVDGSDEEEV